MTDRIKLLPDSVANQIAAGEVIQRPASVIKELVENSVDAEATSIAIAVKDAGRTLIQVVDNGIGMSPTDARLSFERHSTSKITSAQDLFTLHTMGFRGEALASIAAVSQIDLKTMRHDDAIGTHLEINASKVVRQEPSAGIPGTTMAVKNLFFNIPARRKFLKKDSVELSNIMHEFERLALVNPGIELSITHNDTTLHHLTRGNLKQRIGQLFGRSVERGLIPVETETAVVKITGFAGLPQNSRKRGALQYLFVNGRNMRHPYFHKAILHCYEQLIRPDEQPNYFINFEVDPATIDVNIHPTKNEIKFENEQTIWQILAAAVRESLGKFNAVPSIDFDSSGSADDIPVYDPARRPATADFGQLASYNPFAPENSEKHSNGTATSNWRRESSPSLDNWEQLYRRFSQDTPADNNKCTPDEIIIPSSAPPVIDAPELTELPEQPNGIMQLHNRYLLAQSRNGLMIVHQHRAHIRVLYERFLGSISQMPMPSQSVLFPEIVSLQPGQSIMLAEVSDDVQRLGYDLSFLGDNTWSLNGVPSVELHIPHADLIRNIVDDLSEGTEVTKTSVYSSLARQMAKAAAIPSGQSLSQAECEQLFSDLMSLVTPAFTPDGLPVIAELSDRDVEALFAR